MVFERWGDHIRMMCHMHKWKRQGWHGPILCYILYVASLAIWSYKMLIKIHAIHVKFNQVKLLVFNNVQTKNLTFIEQF
jgi:hypothetical protein